MRFIQVNFFILLIITNFKEAIFSNNNLGRSYLWLATLKLKGFERKYQLGFSVI